VGEADGGILHEREVGLGVAPRSWLRHRALRPPGSEALAREGRASDCRLVQSLPGADRSIVAWIEAGQWSPARLDGSPFACEYRVYMHLKVY
jgi:hypothetical protein